MPKSFEKPKDGRLLSYTLATITTLCSERVGRTSDAINLLVGPLLQSQRCVYIKTKEQTKALTLDHAQEKRMELDVRFV